MKKLAITLGIVGGLALMTSAQAGGLKGGKVGILTESTGLGVCFEGNTDGAKAWENLDLGLFPDLPGMTPSKSGGQSGSHLDLTDWDCVPEYLVIKGGNGYVVLHGDDLNEALKDNMVWVSETCLVNGGGNPPDISHWAAFGCRSVPEPSSILASLGALAFGALMMRRSRTA